MTTRRNAALALAATLFGLLAPSCMTERPDRDYVQTNVVDKSLFEGEWYHTHTVIDNDHESTYAWAFAGSVSFDSAPNISLLGSIARIRFVIDEDWLYAYRSYALVDDSERTETGGRDMDIYEPMAAWPVEEHFDIVRRYNPDTGETLNVIEENTTDRPWYERRYMRVNWAGNELVDGYNFNDIDTFDALGLVRRQPAGSFVQEGSPYPEEWLPQWDFTPAERPCGDGEQCSTHEEFLSRYYDRFGPERLYHFSFVTQEIWSPGVWPLLYAWARPYYLQDADLMTASLVTVRHAFLRVPDESQYEPLPMPEEDWERFGAWRIEQATYTWGDYPDDENGLSNFYGQTDALNYWGSRHNLWRESFEYDGQGRRVAIPLAEREVQPITYTLTAGFPAWLLYSAFDLAGEWNASFMETVRVARGEDLPATIIPGSTCDTDADCRAQYGDDYPYTSCRVNNDNTTAGCTRHYNPFLEPDESLRDFDCHIVDANGNLPTDPGTDLATFDDERLEAQRGWRFVGPECALVLRNNTCDDPVSLAAATRDRPACAERPELCCDQMGDLRYNFLAFNDQVGVMWGGVSQPLQDPLTGELIQANANASGLSVEGAMTINNWYFNLVDEDPDRDSLDELNVMVGEDVRALMEASSYAIPPVTPTVPPPIGDPEAGPMNNMFAGLLQRMDETMRRAEDLRGMEGHSRTFSGRFQQLAGTRFERSLLGGAEGMLSMGFVPEDGRTEPTEEMLDQASPFRTGVFDSELQRQALHRRMLERNFCPAADQNPEFFMDHSYVNWLQDLGDLSPQQRSIATGRLYFRSMMLHEMGHSLGMRHQFAGSIDFANYHDEFFHIDDQFPYPVMGEYDLNEDGNLDYDEIGAYQADVQEARENRERAGIARWRSTSVMEYMPRLTNDLAPLGRYDRAFMHYVYGNQVEVYVEDPRENTLTGTTRRRGWMSRPDRAARGYQQYFAAGAPCRIDRDTDTGYPERFHHEDCPMGIMWTAADSSTEPACSAEAPDCPGHLVCDTVNGYCIAPALLGTGQVVGQRCGENPRSDQVNHREDLPGVCMGFQDSWDAYVEFTRGRPAVFPVEYRFCSDDRTSDISWCSTMDEGESFREVMHNYRDRWARAYPFANFRRYRAGWGGSSWFGTFADIAKVLSHYYYRYFYEPGFSDAEEDFWVGWIDHLAGAAEGMNFLAEVIATPDVGSYEYDPDTDTYNLVASGELGQGDLDVPVGLGRYMWSSYQTGTVGITRLERQGSYYDKLYALYALARRDWGMTYSYDERFWINFYSLFPYEMSQLFAGVIMDDPTISGARICPAGHANPFDPDGGVCERDTVFYQDLWRGTCAWDDTECRGNPYDEAYSSLPAIGGGSSEVLRNWALIFSLAEFPVFFDTSYEQQMYLFVEGTGDSFSFRDCGDYPSDPECLEEGVDYARFFSDRYNLSFISMNVERQYDWEPESISAAFQMVQRANELQEQVEACEAGTTPCTDGQLVEWQRGLEELESFFLNVVDIQTQYGISSWL